MGGRWPRYQPDGGQRLEQDDAEARRRHHRHRLSVRRQPEIVKLDRVVLADGKELVLHGR